MSQDFNPAARLPRDFEPPYPGFFVRLAAPAQLALADYVIGLDLSHWRPNTDLPLAKANGIKFIITKCTEGDYFFDDWYRPYHDDCKLLNLPFSGFHYWRANTDPIVQAKWYCDHAAVDHELLDVLDVEKYNNEGVLTQAAAAQHIYDTAQEIQQRRGRAVMIYTSRHMWDFLTGNSPIIAAFPLWVAHWTTASSPTLPVGASDWVLWQYTNSYKLPGISTGYDANRYNGDEQAFQDYLKSINGNNCDCDELKAEIADIQEVQVQHTLRLDELEKGRGWQHKRIKALEDANLDARIAEIERKLAETKAIL